MRRSTRARGDGGDRDQPGAGRREDDPPHTTRSGMERIHGATEVAALCHGTCASAVRIARAVHSPPGNDYLRAVDPGPDPPAGGVDATVQPPSHDPGTRGHGPVSVPYPAAPVPIRCWIK